jgi:hypothetical protein
MATPLLRIFESVFGCHHQDLSRVFTIQKRTYRVCFECGREFDYSWELMHTERPTVADASYTPPNRVRQAEAATS